MYKYKYTHTYLYFFILIHMKRTQEEVVEEACMYACLYAQNGMFTCETSLYVHMHIADIHTHAYVQRGESCKAGETYTYTYI
jgi:hypothetical protein